MDPIVIAGLLAVGCAGGALMLSDGLRDQTMAAERLARLGRAAARDAADAPVTRDGPERSAAGPLLSKLRGRPQFVKLEQMMWQAGVRRPRRLASAAAGACAVLGAVGFALTHDVLLSAAIAGAALFSPLVYGFVRAQRRLQAFARQLPYALDFLKSALEAGHPPLRSLQAVAEEFADPLGGEFRTMVEQAQLGMALPGAFEKLMYRVAEPDLRLLATAVRVQSESGSSLAEIVGRLAAVVRARQKLNGQIRSMTTQSRASAWIVAALPIVLLGVFALIQPTYVRILFFDPLGVKALKFAMALDAIAFVMIRRMLKVEY